MINKDDTKEKVKVDEKQKIQSTSGKKSKDKDSSIDKVKIDAPKKNFITRNKVIMKKKYIPTRKEN